jgi:hypothetical protein
MTVGYKTGGRAAGVPNRRTAARVEAMAQGDGAHALLIAIYQNPDNDMHSRIDAAKAALPYETPRLTSMELKGENGGPIVITWLPPQS